MDDIKNEIVIQALSEFPDAPTMTLAKKLYNEYPEQFTALENVRSMIRYRRGNKGGVSREEAKKNHSKTFREPGKAGFT